MIIATTYSYQICMFGDRQASHFSKTFTQALLTPLPFLPYYFPPLTHVASVATHIAPETTPVMTKLSLLILNLSI